jgi:hypothetical protein
MTGRDDIIWPLRQGSVNIYYEVFDINSVTKYSPQIEAGFWRNSSQAAVQKFEKIERFKETQTI